MAKYIVGDGNRSVEVSAATHEEALKSMLGRSLTYEEVLFPEQATVMVQGQRATKYYAVNEKVAKAPVEEERVVYVLTNYAAGENYTPSVYKDKTKAYKNFVELVKTNVVPYVESRGLYPKDTYRSIDRCTTIEDIYSIVEELGIGGIEYISSKAIAIGDVDETGNLIELFETPLQ